MRHPQRKVTLEMSRVIGLIIILLAVCTAESILADEATDTPPADLALHTASSSGQVPLQEATDEPISLSRDGEGTVLRSFTIEGEDRVSIKFDRPRISLDLDPRSAPGLGWDNAWDKVDVLPAVTAQTAMRPSPYTGKPWLKEYAQDEVVVFNPQAPDMASWKLTIVDSRGKPAMVRQGQGTPPASMAWNGRRDDGTSAWPGLIYSYIMETVDPAGNQRTTSGRGFGLPAYRLTGEQENVLVFSGSEITSDDPAAPAVDLPGTPLIIETASWLNQAPGLTSPIEIRATARNHRQAEYLAGLVNGALSGMVCGDPDRINLVCKVVEDAPDQGVIEIASQGL